MLEERGIPTATVISSSFVSVSELNASTRGYPDLPLAVVPHPVATLSPAEIASVADDALKSVLQAILVR